MIRNTTTRGPNLYFLPQGPNKIPADIVFIVRQKSHPLYVRQGNDLIYKIQISLEMVSLCTRGWREHMEAVVGKKWTRQLFPQALTGFSVDVETVDGRLLTIPINDIVQ